MDIVGVGVGQLNLKSSSQFSIESVRNVNKERKQAQRYLGEQEGGVSMMNQWTAGENNEQAVIRDELPETPFRQQTPRDSALSGPPSAPP